MIFVVGNPVIHKSIHALICDAIIRECFSQRITLTNLVSSLKDVRLEWGRRCNMSKSSNRNLLRLVNKKTDDLVGKTLAKTG